MPTGRYTAFVKTTPKRVEVAARAGKLRPLSVGPGRASVDVRAVSEHDARLQLLDALDLALDDFLAGPCYTGEWITSPVS
jgi:hypothetical protein